MHVANLMTRDVSSVEPDSSLDRAMELMDVHDLRHLAVVEDGRLVGVLSERDLLEVTGWLPRRVRDLLESPTGTVRDFMCSPVVEVSPGDPIATACRRLTQWGIGCLPVLEGTELVGMVTETDVVAAYLEASSGRSLAVTSDPPVDRIMTAAVHTADHRTPADEVLEFCRTKKVRHLPLFDGEILVGLVSDRDLRRCAGRGQLEGTPVREIAALDPITIGPDERLSEASRRLLEHRVGALPVVCEGRLVGMLTMADVLEHCIGALDGPGATGGSGKG